MPSFLAENPGKKDNGVVGRANKLDRTTTTTPRVPIGYLVTARRDDRVYSAPPSDRLRKNSKRAHVVPSYVQPAINFRGSAPAPLYLTPRRARYLPSLLPCVPNQLLHYERQEQDGEKERQTKAMRKRDTHRAEGTREHARPCAPDREDSSARTRASINDDRAVDICALLVRTSLDLLRDLSAMSGTPGG